MAASHGVGGGGTVRTESLRGLICGLCFGVTSPLVSHPLDTIKSRMQALPSAAAMGTLETLKSTLRAGGARALYAGLLPPLLGSAFYRSLQMSAFSAAYAALRDDAALTAPVPQLAGLQLRVLVAGAAATSARALIETPLELLKVRRQLQLPAPRSLRECFSGFLLTWTRLYVALGGFFVAVDHCDRHHPWLFAQPGGSFLKGAVCATACWWLAWPLEVLKNRVQSNQYAGGALAQLRSIVRERGIAGMYRGILPGTLRSILGNGFALLAFDACKQRLQ
jgi:solute carrier family 25 carnitine/acylcarnitine transporter 20/29